MDGDVSLKIFVEYVVTLLVCETFVDCCSFDIVWEVVLNTSFNDSDWNVALALLVEATV